MNGSILTNVAVNILELLGIENPTSEDTGRFVKQIKLDKLPDWALWVLMTGFPFAKWAIIKYVMKLDMPIEEFLKDRNEEEIE